MLDFDISKFDHYATYDPISGACKSYIVSLADQQVSIDEEKINSYRNEPVWTELSQKFSEEEVAALAKDCGFEPLDNFYDCRHDFIDAMWIRI